MAAGDLTLYKTPDDDATVATTLAAIKAAGRTPICMSILGSMLYILVAEDA